MRKKQQYEQSPFTSLSSSHAYESLRSYLDLDYYDQAKRSLIMLKNIKNIEFQLRLFNYHSLESGTHQDSDLRWKVYSLCDNSKVYSEKDDGKQFKHIESYTLNIVTQRLPSTPLSTTWMVVKAFIQNENFVPVPLRKFALEERLVASGRSALQPVPDLAIAAPITGENVDSLFYNSLPFEARCGFPVNFHSRFAISPDRRSLRTDSKGGEWNKFLAESCLPPIYFVFLERLALLCHKAAKFYSFWPTLSGEVQSEISGYLHSAFWDQIRLCTRNIFVDAVKPPAPISQTIFDARAPSEDTTGDDSILLLIRRLRSSHVVVNTPIVLNGLSRSRSAEHPDVAFLTPAYVRNVLQEASAKEKLTRDAFNDSNLNAVVQFVLESRSIKDLEGCWCLRLGNDEMYKVQTWSQCILNCAKIVHIIDKEGYKLFKDLEPGIFISPTVLDDKIANSLALTDTFNVRKFDGAVVDKLLKAKYSAGDVKTFTSDESEWISAIHKYVISHGFSVNHYQTIPTLPLSNKRNTFVSMAAWNRLPVMPPIEHPILCQICNSLEGLYILKSLNFAPLQNLPSAMSSAGRFLDCMYQLMGRNVPSLEKLFREILVSSEDLEVMSYNLRADCVGFEKVICEFLYGFGQVSHSASKRSAQAHTILESFQSIIPSEDFGRPCTSPSRRWASA